MSGKTKIDWCDKVWNPVVGCTPVSDGCRNCYAKRIYERFSKGKPFEKIVLHPDRLDQPFHWKKPSWVFVDSMGDLFHPDIRKGFIVDIFDVIIGNPKHQFLVLTKRPAQMQEFVQWYGEGWYRGHGLAKNAKNLWFGVSVENQQAADERIPLLLQTQVVHRFVSVEPMLDAMDIGQYLWEEDSRDYGISRDGLDWVICGGESGPGARPMDPDWVRLLRDQCVDAGVSFWFKSWGGWAKADDRDDLLDGVEWKQRPEVK